MDLGVDFANYTAVPSREQLRCWWKQGVRFAIVGCQRPEVSLAQLRALAADGRFGTEAYQYYYWDGSEAERTRAALDVMRATGCGRLWIDVEWDEAAGPEPGPDRVVPAIEGIVADVGGAGFEAGIYTSARFWPSMAGNTAAFNRLPLWHADYRQRYGLASLPDFDADFRPYGGWRRPLVWQWAGSTSLCGLNVDLNASDTPIGGGTTKESLMIRHNAAAFENVSLKGRTIVDVAATFGLPPTARMVRLEVMLTRPAYLGVGDGAGGPYAGSLREGERHGSVDVLTPDARLTIDAPDGAEVEFLGVVGYWL